jgi:hypothetical protein
MLLGYVKFIRYFNTLIQQVELRCLEEHDNFKPGLNIFSKIRKKPQNSKCQKCEMVQV